MLYTVVKNLNHKIQSAFDTFSSLPLISDLVKILKKLTLSNFFLCLTFGCPHKDSKT